VTLLPKVNPSLPSFPTLDSDKLALERGGEWRIIGWLDYQARALKPIALQSWATKYTRDQNSVGLDIFTEENTVPLESIPDKFGHRTRSPARPGAPQRSAETVDVDELSASDLESQDGMSSAPIRAERRERLYQGRNRGSKSGGADTASSKNMRWGPSGSAEAPQSFKQEEGAPPMKFGSGERSAPPHLFGRS
jgi:hypothetical protein